MPFGHTRTRFPVVYSVLLLLGELIFGTKMVSAGQIPRIATWYMNKAAAVSLRFDDSLESHVDYVIPKLNEYGIQATFMINPGLDRYQKNRSFWENQAPAMGHELGNHTLHHYGAKTPEEADTEIGEVSRLIRKLCPKRSRLLVFASGGGRARWGGKEWRDASPEYKALVKKYELIDLYDGHHPALGGRSEIGYDGIVQAIRNAVDGRAHLAIAFHKIGKPNLIDRLKAIYRGYDLTFPEESFDRVLAFLGERRAAIWTAPVGDILKYEEERTSATLVQTSKSPRQIVLTLTVGTELEHYDQDLTVIVPIAKEHKVKTVSQGGRRIETYSLGDRELLVNVRPVNGNIEISFK